MMAPNQPKAVPVLHPAVTTTTTTTTTPTRNSVKVGGSFRHWRIKRRERQDRLRQQVEQRPQDQQQNRHADVLATSTGLPVGTRAFRRVTKRQKRDLRQEEEEEDVQESSSYTARASTTTSDLEETKQEDVIVSKHTHIFVTRVIIEPPEAKRKESSHALTIGEVGMLMGDKTTPTVLVQPCCLEEEEEKEEEDEAGEEVELGAALVMLEEHGDSHTQTESEEKEKAKIPPSLQKVTEVKLSPVKASEPSRQASLHKAKELEDGILPAEAQEYFFKRSSSTSQFLVEIDEKQRQDEYIIEDDETKVEEEPSLLGWILNGHPRHPPLARPIVKQMGLLDDGADGTDNHKENPPQSKSQLAGFGIPSSLQEVTEGESSPIKLVPEAVQEYEQSRQASLHKRKELEYEILVTEDEEGYFFQRSSSATKFLVEIDKKHIHDVHIIEVEDEPSLLCWILNFHRPHPPMARPIVNQEELRPQCLQKSLLNDGDDRADNHQENPPQGKSKATSSPLGGFGIPSSLQEGTEVEPSPYKLLRQEYDPSRQASVHEDEEEAAEAELEPSILLWEEDGDNDDDTQPESEEKQNLKIPSSLQEVKEVKPATFKLLPEVGQEYEPSHQASLHKGKELEDGLLAAEDKQEYFFQRSSSATHFLVEIDEKHIQEEHMIEVEVEVEVEPSLLCWLLNAHRSHPPITKRIVKQRRFHPRCRQKSLLDNDDDGTGSHQENTPQVKSKAASSPDLSDHRRKGKDIDNDSCAAPTVASSSCSLGSLNDLFLPDVAWKIVNGLWKGSYLDECTFCTDGTDVVDSCSLTQPSYVRQEIKGDNDDDSVFDRVTVTGNKTVPFVVMVPQRKTGERRRRVTTILEQ